eukprot:1156508-Pelagomonas_calceolata.AAC.6
MRFKPSPLVALKNDGQPERKSIVYLPGNTCRYAGLVLTVKSAMLRVKMRNSCPKTIQTEYAGLEPTAISFNSAFQHTWSACKAQPLWTKAVFACNAAATASCFTCRPASSKPVPKGEMKQ